MKTKIFKPIVTIGFAIICILLNSCLKDGDFEFDKLAKNQYDPSLAAPLINSKLTLKDILKDTTGIIQVNTDNSLKLVYKSNNLVSLMAKDIFIIPNQSILTDTNNLNLTLPSPGDSNYLILTNNYKFALPEQDQRIDSFFIKKATLKLSINTDINHKSRLRLTIPDVIMQNGNPFILDVPIDYNGWACPYTITIPPIDLSGCRIKFNNAPGHKNEVTFKYEHYIYHDNYPLNPNYFIYLNNEMADIEYAKLFGYIGQQSFPMYDTTEISIFTTQTYGNFNFNNVKVSMDVKNSFGIPSEIKVEKFMAINGNNVVNINDFPNPNPLPINSPNVNQVGQYATTNIPSVTSTDLANAFNIAPKKIIYKVNGKLYPVPDPTHESFVLDTSAIKVDFNIELPLYGKIGGFVLQDTLKFDLSKIKDIAEASFMINMLNHFPLDADVQVYFTDASYQILDSLIIDGTNIIKSGIVGSNDMVSVPTFKSTQINVNNTRLRKIENSKFMFINARLKTFDFPNRDVKISNEDYINVKMGIKVKTKLNL